jgi:endonuclease/exonuclease/phosphatase family metal-dependent hydrolase
MSFIYHIFLFLLVTAFALNAQNETSVMTFNIRYDNPEDGANEWKERKEEVVGLIKHYHPDILGIQEAMPDQTRFLELKLDGYSFIGHGRDGKDTDSEGIPLFFKTSIFQVIDSDIFWMSETPDRVSKGWDAHLNRITVYAALKNHETGEVIHIFNCHFDHIGEVARRKSAELILTRIRELDLIDRQVVVMGDFNCTPQEDPVVILKKQLQDSFISTKSLPHWPEGTFNAFDTQKQAKNRIDYIFTQNLHVLSHRIIDDRRKNNLHISDHFPVLITLKQN